MWVKTTQAKFEQYGIAISTQRQLSDGEYIMHMELTEYPQFILEARFDEDVEFMTTEQMDVILLQEQGE